jgi:1-phosphatidylinositol-4-phosphate 5-kinase
MAAADSATDLAPKRSPMGNPTRATGRRDLRHGQGVYTFANGGELNGTWRAGRLQQGAGMFIFPDGSMYEGQWQNDQIWGEGVFTRVNGEQIQGTLAG